MAIPQRLHKPSPAARHKTGLSAPVRIHPESNTLTPDSKETNLVIMKVKVGHLKTHLSRYLKEIRKSGESIEVCLREEPVAYLTPCDEQKKPGVAPRSDPDLARQLAADGLTITHWGRKNPTAPTPGHCGSPAGGPNSMESIRAEKNW